MNYLIALILCFGLSGSRNATPEDYSSILKEINSAPGEGLEAKFKQNNIKILGLDGHIISEYKLDEVVENKLPLNTLQEIQESDFLFEYQGDSYYLISE